MFQHLLASALLSLSGSDGPFADLAYEAALAQAKEKHKLLFVDFTASWCGPCKRMEADVWPHADVRAWLGEHAIAIQVDVDAQPELSKRFAIEAMPTIVVLRDGEEFDRVVGYKDVPELLDWAKDVAAGKRSSDELSERARVLAESTDVDARYDLAQDLMRAKQYELALGHYLWLWPATRSVPKMSGVRLSFMLSEMAQLARKHAPAKRAFLELLEALQARVDGAAFPESLDWQEWSAMGKSFGQPERMIAWYEKHRDEAGRLLAEQASDVRVETIVGDVFDVLMQADRPLDAVRLFADARTRAQSLVRRYEQMTNVPAGSDEVWRVEMQAQARRGLTNDFVELYVALLAAARGEEAGDVAALLIRTLDTPDSRLALVRAGLAAAAPPTASLTRWLDEAEAAGGNVKTMRRRLERLTAAPAATDGGK